MQSIYEYFVCKLDINFFLKKINLLMEKIKRKEIRFKKKIEISIFINQEA
jgi:hypothetical protein